MLLLNLAACNSQVPHEVPRGEIPDTPQKEAWDALQPIDFDMLVEDVEPLDTERTVRVYTLQGQLNNGSALKFFPR